MFDPKAEVPSLELCKRLKELGFPQEGGWYWIKDEGEWIIVFSEDGESYLLEYSGGEGEYFTAKLPEDKVKAPTCRELGEWLPRVIEDYFLEFLPKGKKILDWWVVYRNQNKTKILIPADTEPNARAKMLIWLVENGYVKLRR